MDAGIESSASPRLLRARWRPGVPLRMFCLPYAGGSASLFHRWPERLADLVDVGAVELPGRGRRLAEPAHERTAPLVEELLEGLRSQLDVPFVLFGHSMGALLAFELARVLRRRDGPMPRALLVSGCGAPHLSSPRPSIHDLPADEFASALRALNGTPPEVFDHPDLLDVLMPTLRADFKLCETYAFIAEPPLDCPIVAFGGTEDTDVTLTALDAWREHSRARFTSYVCPGGHLFLQTAESWVLDLIARELAMGLAIQP